MIKIEIQNKFYIGLNDEIEKKINLAKGPKKSKEWGSKSTKKQNNFLLNCEIKRKNHFNKKEKRMRTKLIKKKYTINLD